MRHRLRYKRRQAISPERLFLTAGALVAGMMAVSSSIRPVSFVVRALSLSTTTPTATTTSSSGSGSQRRRIAVVGGGASGIFAAVAAAAAESSPTKPAADDAAAVVVTVLEATSKTLTKVKISGGGRCNVLHDTSKPVHELLQGYPRGKKELNGLLHKRFGPVQAQEWFESRGVQLKTEQDGRMFPTTDNSQTIMDALLNSAAKAHVTIRTRCQVDAINVNEKDGSFCLSIREKEGRRGQEKRCVESYDAVILATGSVPVGYRLAESLGHTIVPTVPSLFTLNAKQAVREGGLLNGLSGVSVPLARVSFRLPAGDESGEDGEPKPKKRRKKPKVLEQQGPLLITHHGLSGPAALRLSAFGAREFAACNYRGHLIVHFAPELGTTDQVADLLWKVTNANPKKTVVSVCPLLFSSSSSSESGTTAIPRRLWAALVLAAGFEPGHTWGQASKKLVRKLAMQICECPIEMTGKGTFKDEFVTAGGVLLKEINMTTMESKKCPGLFFCGELIDVDGVTGGYNFLNAWSTGFVAGKSASYLHSVSSPHSVPKDDKAASA